MKSLVIVILVCICAAGVYGQPKKDSVGTFPVIKSYKWAAVHAVARRDFRPDPKSKYKIVIDFSVGPSNPKKDSLLIHDVNWGFGEVARLINLHVADGIPVKNVEVVLAIHGPAIFSIMTDEAYEKKYNIKNPSLTLIQELQNAGVKMYVCGQAMYFLGVKSEAIIPSVVQALTAQTIMTNFVTKGYQRQDYFNWPE